MKHLAIDIESFSSAPFNKYGVYKYASSPDFEIPLFGHSADGGPIQVADFTAGEQLSAEVLSVLTDSAVTKWAFNAQFERVCLSRWLGMPVGEYLEPDSWRCTMVWSAALGLPLSLDAPKRCPRSRRSCWVSQSTCRCWAVISSSFCKQPLPFDRTFLIRFHRVILKEQRRKCNIFPVVPPAIFSP